MTTPDTDSPQWTLVDEGWGRKAVDFATLSEPGNCREYVTMHHRLGVDAGDRLLDVACGSGLAIELARLRGATGSGLDASPRLVAVARDRNPGCDIRVGDMHALPWDRGSFDVVTSFRGIWGTTPDAVAEIYRVLRPGGRARDHGLGSHQDLPRRLGAGAVPARRDRRRSTTRRRWCRLAGRGRASSSSPPTGSPISSASTCRSRGNSPTPRSTPGRWPPPAPPMRPSSRSARPNSIARRSSWREGRQRDGLPLRAEINLVGYLARKPEGAQRP